VPFDQPTSYGCHFGMHFRPLGDHFDPNFRSCGLLFDPLLWIDDAYFLDEGQLRRATRHNPCTD